MDDPIAAGYCDFEFLIGGGYSLRICIRITECWYFFRNSWPFFKTFTLFLMAFLEDLLQL